MRSNLFSLSYTTGTAGAGGSWKSRSYPLSTVQGAWANAARRRYGDEVKGLRIITNYGVTLVIIATDHNGVPLSWPVPDHGEPDYWYAVLFRANDSKWAGRGGLSLSDKRGITRILSGLLAFDYLRGVK